MLEDTDTIEAVDETGRTGSAKATAYDFEADFQGKIVTLALRDTTFIQRTDGLIQPDYFENDVDRALIRVALDYHGTYKKAPDVKSLGTVVRDAILAKRVDRALVPEVKARVREIVTADVSDREYVIEKVADFARHQAMTAAIMESVVALERGDFAKIEKLIKTAQLVGAAEGSDDYDYWAEIETRTQTRKDIAAGIIKRDGITTGYPDLDKFLYHHGWGRKELSVIMGAAKAGKSMSLGEFGKSAALAGFNALYVTLEVSRNIISDRIDANIADTAIRALGTTPFEVEKRIKAAAGKAGKFHIREYPTGLFKASALRRMLEDYRARGVVFDLVIVDYADIMAPERMTGELRDDMRAIYIDLRAIAFEYNCAVLTATQTNREGAKSAVARMTDVAEDFNKIRTADIVISINSTEEERKSGEARLFFAASRNSESGFTLRIKQDREKMKFLTKVLGKE